ncbi:MAG: hypothetical protein F6K36_27930 [Symploca sp. SIO3C6]|uniref:SPOR domain-containing protein n=1 Tax=Symploca sp. SIO1C4 TaxID=2607765 RepID=A0A6B3NJQ1_9CYAN|nr:hypothetical protein [Symploca sp. SIO3C6]NER31857.1 hypothetical protein [Symploca sp. SIO1C4]
MYDQKSHEPWTIVRLISPVQWVVVSRYRSRADAERNLNFCRQQIAEIKFELVFDPPIEKGDKH